MTDNSGQTKPLQNIVILMAMADEARPIVESLAMIENKQALHHELPMRCYQKAIDGINLSLLVSGIDYRHQVDNVGSEAATLMAYEAVTRLQPDLLISAGTAGGFAKNGAEIGTVYGSERFFVYHDRHVPIRGLAQSAIGEYPAAKIGRLAKDLGLPTGVISTGSSLEKSEKDILVINQYGAVAKEMEAAGIAWVAMLFNIPMMALKSITNLLDEENKSEHEFVANLSYASKTLQGKIIELITYLKNKSIEDLE